MLLNQSRIQRSAVYIAKVFKGFFIEKKFCKNIKMSSVKFFNGYSMPIVGLGTWQVKIWL